MADTTGAAQEAGGVDENVGVTADGGAAAAAAGAKPAISSAAGHAGDGIGGTQGVGAGSGGENGHGGDDDEVMDTSRLDEASREKEATLVDVKVVVMRGGDRMGSAGSGKKETKPTSEDEMGGDIKTEAKEEVAAETQTVDSQDGSKETSDSTEAAAAATATVTASRTDKGNQGASDTVELGQAQKVRLDPAATVEATIEALVREVGDAPRPRTAAVRLWQVGKEGKVEKRVDASRDAAAADAFDLSSLSAILVEIQAADGTWPRGDPAAGAAATGARAGNGGGGGGDGGGGHVAGVVGLMNLGNTCFMNAALQCLSQTPDLTRFFLEGEWKADVNSTNPLGSGGELVRQYAALVREIWGEAEGGGVDGDKKRARSGVKGVAVNPKSFKDTVGKHCPQFKGFRQHDTQELLSYLLDTLHEDLNRVKEKPYVELDQENVPDAEAAAAAQEAHNKRNDSMVNDLFQGLFKSQVTCKECEKRSTTFDPFTLVSLPIPEREKHDKVFPALYFESCDSAPRRLEAAVAKTGSTVGDLIASVAEQTFVPPEELVACDVDKREVRSVLDPSRRLIGVRNHSVVHIFRLTSDDAAGAAGRKARIVPVVHKIARRSVASPNVQRLEAVGNPSILRVREGTTRQRDVLALLREGVGSVLRSAAAAAGGGDSAGTGGEEGEGDVGSGGPGDELKMEGGADEMAAETGEGENSEAAAGQGQGGEPEGGDMSAADGAAEVASADPFVVHLMSQHSTRNLSLTRPQRVVEDKETPLGLQDSDVFVVVWDAEWVKAHDTPTTKSFFGPSGDSALAATPRSRNRGKAASDISPVHVSQCFDLFTKEENLGADDLWYCPACKDHKQATKKIELWNLPPVLILHLKRFKYDRYKREKLGGLVTCPDQLDLENYTLDPNQKAKNKYRLYAVANHSGGLGGGHYTATARHEETGKFYSFNDSFTQEHRGDPVSSGAYVLFYKRVADGDADDGSGGAGDGGAGKQPNEGGGESAGAVS